MGIVIKRPLEKQRDFEFTTINCSEDIENGMQMDYRKDEFTKMPIRPSAGAGLGGKIKRKIQSASDYLRGEDFN